MKNINLLFVLVLLITATGCKKDDDKDTGTCTKPVATIQTANGQASVSIVGPDNATYELEYGAVGFSQGNGTSISGSNTVTISGLANGSYDLYVRSACSASSLSDWAKESFTVAGTGNVPKIKTYKQQYTNQPDVTYTYTYNADGKLLSELTDVNSGAYYAYSGNKIVQTGLSGDTLLVYTTNSEGYVVSAVDPANTYLYEYNADWNMTNSNGNMATWGGGNRLTANNGVNVYTYYTDKTNTIGNENRGQKYFGVDSKNLIQTLQFSNFSTTTYTYEYDVQGRVSKRLTSNSTETYTYY